MDYLSNSNANQVILSPRHEYPESTFKKSLTLNVDPSVVFNELADRSSNLTIDDSWIEEFHRLEDVSQESLTDYLNSISELSEPVLTRKIFESIPDESNIFISNSTPIRDVIQFCNHEERPLYIHANRGTSGIDGQISTTAGLSWNAIDRVFGIVGDIGTIHDLNGLLNFSRHDIDCSLMIINNDGGGIFHRLPIEDFDPPFGDYVKTSHGLDFEFSSKQFDADYRKVTRETDLDSALEWATEPADGLKITEFITDSERSQRDRERFRDELQSVIDDQTF
jgi:2-succinyl-5-enolpyruvyl-6-hydroxy-3-cyclohexene-1-carboxylate synthase